MAHNQDIHDGGSIIGYRPQLQYIKELNQESDLVEEQQSDSIESDDISKYSTTLQSFIESSPNEMLQSLQTSSEYLQKLIDKLSKAFPNGTYQEYGTIAAYLNSLYTQSTAFSMEFLNYHKYDINGSQIPELIDCIYCAKHRIDRVSEIVKQLYYGNSYISIISAKEIDDAYIAQLRTLENSDIQERVNYFALAVDSELNRVIITHTFGINKLAMRIAKIPDSKDDSRADSANVDLIKSLFDEVNTELDGRLFTYNSQQGIDIVEKALYNYHQKRKNAIGLYSLMTDAHTSSLFSQKIQEKQSEVTEAIANISRSLRATELYTTEFARLEQEKHFLKDVYSSLNYNSNN